MLPTTSITILECIHSLISLNTEDTCRAHARYLEQVAHGHCGTLGSLSTLVCEVPSLEFFKKLGQTDLQEKITKQL